MLSVLYWTDFFVTQLHFFLTDVVTKSPKNGKLSVGSASSTVMISGKPEIWVKWEKLLLCSIKPSDDFPLVLL